MNRYYGPIARAALLLFALSASCVSLERSYPEKRFFVVELGDTAQRSNPAGDQTLLVSGLRVSPRYADKSFVYRTSESGYESDFYNQFLTSPDTMLSEEVRKGLGASPAFKYVIGPSSQLQPNYVLEGSVNALYGDFRNLNKPAAVLEIEFFLHNEDSANPGIVLQKRYIKTVPLSGRSPEALIKGWSQALESILADLNTDLQNAKS
jgi:cholesterol transport system auxiliary component